MLERRRAALSRDAAPRGEPSSSVPAPSGTSSQWTPTHVQEQEFWDGRSPQYVAPSVLYQGSPLHSQESHATSYSPEQILSGAHLTGTSPGHQREPPSFQYTSSSLSAALSHPSSVTQSPDPHGYYPSATFSPNHAPSGLSDIEAPAATTRSGTYGSHDFPFIPIHDDNHDHATTESSQHIAGHPPSPSPAAEECIEPPDAAAIYDPAVPSDSPASPSQCGSPSPPGSPTPPPGNHTVNDTGAGVDPVYAPRPYYRTDAEKAQSAATPRRSNSQRPTRLSSLLPATTE